MTTRRLPGVLLVALLAAASGAWGATIVLKDGSIVEGVILEEKKTSTTIRVRTPFDERLINRKDIDKIFDEEAVDQTGLSKFEELPEKVRSLLNARADYRLGNYQRVIDRLQPFAEKETQAGLKSAMLWPIIESKERAAQWDEVRKMLEEREKSGTPEDKHRARAHLDILDDNKEWDYSLRRVDKAWARNFLPVEMRADAQDPNALARQDMMAKALEEYCSQLVRDEKSGVATVRERMDPRKTVEEVRKLPKGVRSQDVLERMPYYEELRRAETSIHKAQAILPGYADAFQLDLIRAEGEQLTRALETLLGEAIQTSPLNIPLPKTPDAAARQQWQQACDDWLTKTDPVEKVGEYFLDKLNAYPKEMRMEWHMIRDVQDRLIEMRESVRRQRRTR